MSQAAPTQQSPTATAKSAAAPKTRRILNTPLLVASLVVLGVLGVAAGGWHRYQSNQVAGAFLQRAIALEEEGKWSEAASYFAHYLQLEPSDTDARLRLVAAVEKSDASGPGRYRLVALLYHTLGDLPERYDLRLKLAEQLLTLQDFAGAKTQATKLAESGDEKTKVAARRILALVISAQARPDGLVSIAEAATALRAALADNPGDVEVAAITANIFRMYPELVGKDATPLKADQIMNAMVSANPKNAKAMLARYQYRSRHDPHLAASDLEAALVLEPNNVDALLMSAEATLAARDTSQLEKAKRKGEQVVELQPQDPRGYLVVARLRGLGGDSRGAAATLEEGRKKLQAVNLDLDYMLASILLDLGEVHKSRNVTTEFSSEVDRWLPELPTDSRINLENKRRMLQGRLAISAGDLPRAAREFEAIIAATDENSNSAMPMEWVVAHDLLGTILSQQQRPDLAAVHWSKIAGRVPGYTQSSLKAAKANLEAGRAEVAVSQLTEYLKLPNADPEAQLTLLQAQMQQAVSRPAPERDWKPFVETLRVVRDKFPDRWEWQLAEFAYLVSQDSSPGHKQSLDRLRQIERQFENNIKVSERLVVYYQQLSDQESVERVLDNYDKIQPKATRRATLHAALLASQNRIPDALVLLEETEAKSNEAEAAGLKLTRLKLLMATQQLDPAHKLVSQLINDSPADKQLLTIGLEIALRQGDSSDARKWEGMLKDAASFDNFEWRYYRARRLVGEFAQLNVDDRAELERLVESLRSERPGWLPVITLGAQYASVKGNRRDAIDAFQSALNAGDTRVETLEQLVRLLYAEGRFEEATQCLSRVQADDRSKTHFESLAIAAAVQGNRFNEARDLARQAVERGSQDPLHYLWLADLARTSGDQQAAQETYRTALQRFPKDVRVWNAVFSHFVQTRQIDRARQTLQRMVEQVPLTESQKLLVMGQGNESLGDRQAAQNYYREATVKEPKDTTARFLLAKSLMSSDLGAAREELQRVLEIDPTQVESRRLLAVLLSASGDDADWAKAQQFLEVRGDDSTSVIKGDDDRLRVILVARQGKNREERIDNLAAARELLTEKLEQSPSDFNDLDRMLLAGIYEQEALLNDEVGPLQAARDTLRPLVDRAEPSIDALASYIQFLLRNVSAPEGANESNAVTDLRKVFAEDARLRLDTLEKLIAKQPGNDQQLMLTAMRMKLLGAQGRKDDALKLINDVVEQQLAGAKADSDRAKVFLQAGNLCTQERAYVAAEGWYRQLEGVMPKAYILVAQSLLQQGKANEAVEFCFERAKNTSSSELATLLAQILTSGKVGAEVNRKSLQVIESALDADRGNVELLMAVAVLRLTQGNEDEAIRMFRRVVELRPKNTLALNNLATLLAERPAERNEALQYIERAMESAGRLPALLDTQGTILYHLGRHQEAVTALEEAVSGGASDSRYFFHLAVAYDGAGRKADAQRAFETAVGYGLDKAMLTKGDRELLASLKQTLLTANTRD